MPDPAAPPASPRITFVVHGKKPRKCRLPGLDIGPVGRVAGRPVLWRCYLDGLYSN